MKEMGTMISTEELIKRAAAVRANAYAPYSKYKVGAALLAKDGRIFCGCNMENASYGLTICAERNAITTAIAEGCRDFEQIVIVAEGERPVPCGACLQVMSEFAREIRVTVAAPDGTNRTDYTFMDLMPQQFILRKNEN